MNKLEASYDYCEEMIKNNSATFYKAFSFLPDDQKKAVWAIYAFCRSIDDIIDESTNPKRGIVQFEQEFEFFKNGKILEHNPIWIALEDVFKNYDMEEQPFNDMITGQKMDLVKNRYETIEEFLEYSYYVASSVGLMLLPVLAPGKTEILRDGAIKLGLAMQITNILRDVGEDLMKGRIYLPKEGFIKHGYSMKEFLHHEVNNRFISMWEELAQLAENYYSDALTTVDEYPEYSRIPVKSSAYLYRAILNEIRKNDYDVFCKKNYVSNELKAKVLEII